MTNIVISKDRKLMLINGVRCVATGVYDCSINCLVMRARCSALSRNDSEDHHRICARCCNGRCAGMVVLAKEEV